MDMVDLNKKPGGTEGEGSARTFGGLGVEILRVPGGVTDGLAPSQKRVLAVGCAIWKSSTNDMLYIFIVSVLLA
jgi:hypothetical protein